MDARSQLITAARLNDCHWSRHRNRLFNDDGFLNSNRGLNWIRLWHWHWFLNDDFLLNGYMLLHRVRLRHGYWLFDNHLFLDWNRPVNVNRLVDMDRSIDYDWLFDMHRLLDIVGLWNRNRSIYIDLLLDGHWFFFLNNDRLLHDDWLLNDCRRRWRTSRNHREGAAGSERHRTASVDDDTAHATSTKQLLDHSNPRRHAAMVMVVVVVMMLGRPARWKLIVMDDMLDCNNRLGWRRWHRYDQRLGLWFRFWHLHVHDNLLRLGRRARGRWLLDDDSLWLWFDNRHLTFAHIVFKIVVLVNDPVALLANVGKLLFKIVRLVGCLLGLLKVFVDHFYFLRPLDLFHDLVSSLFAKIKQVLAL